MKKNFDKKAVVLIILLVFILSSLSPVIGEQVLKNGNVTINYESLDRDLIPPEIYNVDASPDPQIVGSNVNITCDVTDDVEVNVVKVDITYPDSTSVNLTMDTGYYLNQTYLQSGTHSYYIWANDTSDNENTSAKYDFYFYDSSVIYVDDDYSSQSPGWQIDCFDSVQDGINAVADNGDVFVADGSYSEQVRINKSITLTGESRNGVIVNPDGSEFEGPRSGVDKVRSAVTFESGCDGAVLCNIAVENDYDSDLNGNSGIEVIDGGIDGVYINNVSVADVSGHGFGSYHTDHTWPPPEGWVVENSSFSTSDTSTWSGMRPQNMKSMVIRDCDIGQTNYGGILLINSNNTVVRGCSVHDTVRAGIQVDSYCTGVIDIIDNEVWDTNSAHSSDYGDIRLYAQYTPDPHGDGAANVSIYGNVFRDGFNGVCVKSGQDISTRIVTVYENNISNHSNYGVLNAGVGVLNAAYNWWGDASGPGGEGPGTGDNVSVNVVYAPWYVDEGMTTLSTPSVVYVDDDYSSSSPGWGYDHFDSIQDGINAVILNGYVYVADGTYNEQVRINKTIILTGESRNGVIVDPDGLEFEGPRSGVDKVRSAVCFESGCDGAVLSNLTVENDYASDLNGNSGIEVIDGGIDNVYINNVTVSGVSGNGFGSYHTDHTWPPPEGWVVENSSFSTSDTSTWSGMRPQNMKSMVIRDCDIGPTNYGGILLINSNNTVVRGCSVHDTVRAGIQVDSYCTNVIEIVGNDIYNTNSAEASDYGDIRLYGQYTPDPHGDGAANVSIYGNVFRDGFNGVCVKSGQDISTRIVTVYENNISNHSNYGVLNAGVGVLNAAYNWWGDASGPGGEGPGTGDNVSVNVVYAPWYVDEGMTTLSDNVAPEISDVTLTMSDPIDTNPTYGWENITCTVTDDNEVDEVNLTVTYPDLHTENISMIYAGAGVYYHNTTFSSVGTYSYFIWANDTSDNTNMSSIDTFDISPNWDIDMNGQIFLQDLVKVSIKYGQSGPNGWIREDVNNDGEIFLTDFVQVSLHYGETWP